MKTKPGQVAEIQLHSVSRNLIVGFEGDEIYQSALRKLEQGITWPKYPGIKIHGWSTSEYLTPITIMNWSKYLNFEKLKARLETYGKIISFQFGVFKEDPLCKNGNIHLRMKLKEGAVIPAFVEIPGAAECLQIYSDNTEKVCFRCTEKGHIAPFCRKKAKQVDYTKNQNPTWACIASQNLGDNTPNSVEVVQSNVVDGASAIVTSVAGSSKQNDAPKENLTAPSQTSSTPKATKEGKKARKAEEEALPGKNLSSKKKVKKAKYPEGQQMIVDSSDDDMDQDVESEVEKDKANDSDKSQEKSSQNSYQKNDVNDSSPADNPSQRIEEFSSQDSSQSSASMLPPGQGSPGNFGGLRQKTLSVGDLSYSDSDLSTQASELKRQKEHEEQVLWNACAN